MNENKDFLEKVVKAFPIASTDVYRSSINGLLLEPDGNRMTIVATDGHRMIIEKSLLGVAVPTTSLFVRKHHVEVMKQILRFYKKAVPNVEWYKNEMVVGEFRLQLELGTNYPNYKQLLPDFTPTIEVGLNASLLEGLAKAAKTGRYEVVKLSIKDQLSPILVSVPGNDRAQMVLMPARV